MGLGCLCHVMLCMLFHACIATNGMNKLIQLHVLFRDYQGKKKVMSGTLKVSGYYLMC